MPRRSWRRRAAQVMLWVLAGVGAAGLMALVVWGVWRIPQALYAYVPEPKDRASVEATTRTGLIAGLAGLAALGSLALTSRTYRLTQQGQLTDRYTKAIAQLGDDKLDVRLGGIYALEQLAYDSTGARDRAAIVDVLSAFVRVHSDPVYRLRSHLAWVGQDQLQQSGREQRLAKEHVGDRSLPVDVQAAAAALGRLPGKADLSGAYLREVQLGGADLTKAQLR